MLLVKPLPELGDLKGTIFDFEVAGDVLGKHFHTEDNTRVINIVKQMGGHVGHTDVEAQYPKPE